MASNRTTVSQPRTRKSRKARKVNADERLLYALLSGGESDEDGRDDDDGRDARDRYDDGFNDFDPDAPQDR